MLSSPFAASFLWAGLLIFFVIVETVTVGLVSIWLAVGALAALAASFWTDSVISQLIVFLAVSIVSLILTRPLVKKLRTGRKSATNADTVLGTRAVVTVAIDNLRETGRVQQGGLSWNARSTDPKVTIEQGATVLVDRIEGVTAYVHPIVTEPNEERI